MSDDAAQAVSEAPPAPRSKLPIIILSALLAAGAAGAAVYFVTAGQRDADAAESGKQEKTEAAKGPTLYVKFDPPFVVNFEAKGMMRFLQVSIEVMTRDPATAELVKLHDARLRNDLLMLLGNQSYETISTREGKERLRAEALAVVAKVIAAEGGKAPKVEQLYFTSFVMQ